METIPSTEKAMADKAARDGDEAVLADFLQRYQDHAQIVARHGEISGYKTSNSFAEKARLTIAHTHCFNTWADYENFQKEIRTEGSVLAQFEQAADAIAFGDADKLQSLLAQNPGLISMRSTRNHHSTLLNYVGANGFEGYRQITPPNAVEIASVLLAVGAEVDTWGDMYRGTTTLGLVATSVHPVVTGVQEPLMEILLQHGADPNHAVAPDYTDGNLVLACLHNGRYEPIHYLASKGADIDLEGAGGLGDLEKVKSYFTSDGGLIDQTLTTKRDGCLIWACVYGHGTVVEFLLTHGCTVHTVWDNTTPLHSAAFGGQLELVKMLLDKGAPMEVLNEYGGTVLGTTLWALYNCRKPGHLEIMETLIAAGADVKEEWQVYINELRK